MAVGPALAFGSIAGVGILPCSLGLGDLAKIDHELLVIEWPSVQWSLKAVQFGRSLKVDIGLEAEKVRTCCWVETIVCPGSMTDVAEIDVMEQRAVIQQLVRIV